MSAVSTNMSEDTLQATVRDLDSILRIRDLGFLEEAARRLEQHPYPLRQAMTLFETREPAELESAGLTQGLVQDAQAVIREMERLRPMLRRHHHYALAGIDDDARVEILRQLADADPDTVAWHDELRLLEPGRVRRLLAEAARLLKREDVLAIEADMAAGRRPSSDVHGEAVQRLSEIGRELSGPWRCELPEEAVERIREFHDRIEAWLQADRDFEDALSNLDQLLRQRADLGRVDEELQRLRVSASILGRFVPASIEERREDLRLEIGRHRLIRMAIMGVLLMLVLAGIGVGGHYAWVEYSHRRDVEEARGVLRKASGIQELGALKALKEEVVRMLGAGSERLRNDRSIQAEVVALNGKIGIAEATIAHREQELRLRRRILEEDGELTEEARNDFLSQAGALGLKADAMSLVDKARRLDDYRRAVDDLARHVGNMEKNPPSDEAEGVPGLKVWSERKGRLEKAHADIERTFKQMQRDQSLACGTLETLRARLTKVSKRLSPVMVAASRRAKAIESGLNRRRLKLKLLLAGRELGRDYTSFEQAAAAYAGAFATDPWTPILNERLKNLVRARGLVRWGEQAKELKLELPRSQAEARALVDRLKGIAKSLGGHATGSSNTALVSSLGRIQSYSESALAGLDPGHVAPIVSALEAKPYSLGKDLYLVPGERGRSFYFLGEPELRPARRRVGGWELRGQHGTSWDEILNAGPNKVLRVERDRGSTRMRFSALRQEVEEILEEARSKGDWSALGARVALMIQKRTELPASPRVDLLVAALEVAEAASWPPPGPEFGEDLKKLRAAAGNNAWLDAKSNEGIIAERDSKRLIQEMRTGSLARMANGEGLPSIEPLRPRRLLGVVMPPDDSHEGNWIHYFEHDRGFTIEVPSSHKRELRFSKLGVSGKDDPSQDQLDRLGIFTLLYTPDGI